MKVILFVLLICLLPGCDNTPKTDYIPSLYWCSFVGSDGIFTTAGYSVMKLDNNIHLEKYYPITDTRAVLDIYPDGSALFMLTTNGKTEVNPVKCKVIK